METILLIDDDCDLLTNTERILTLSNYKVIKAESGREGLERIIENQGNLSLILCDVTMPGIDGYGVFHAFKNSSQTPEIPFIFLTANSERDDVRRGMDIGADDYLTKPFSRNELLSLVAARLKKINNTREAGISGAVKLGNIFFDQADFDFTAHFKKKFYQKRILKNEVLYNEGERSFYIYYIIKGNVKIIKSDKLGREFITNIYGTNDFFGFNALMEGGTHVDSAVILDDSEIAIFSKNDFLEMLFQSRETCTKFIKHISNLLNSAEEKLPKLAYHSARKKVADALVYVAKAYCKVPGEKKFYVSRHDLSAISGISAESVSRNLTEFKNEGLIMNQNGELVILNLKKLETLRN